MSISVDVWHTFEEVEPLRSAWDTFVEANGADIFLTYDWCRIWWKHYRRGRELHLLIARDAQGELAAVLPLFLESIRCGPVVTRVVKIVGSDFTLAQFSPSIKPEHLADVVAEMRSYLAGLRYDIVYFGPLAGRYEWRNELASAFQNAFGSDHRVYGAKSGSQTYFEVCASWEEYLSRLKKKDRQLFRKVYKEIAESRLSLTTSHASTSNLSERFESFVAAHQAYWQKKGRNGHFGDWPESREFHRELAAHQLRCGRLRLLQVSVGDDQHVYQYSYKCGRRYYELLMGRSESAGKPLDLGRLVFGEQMHRAMAEHADHVDSMRGIYEYKVRFGGEVLPMYSCLLIRRGLPIMRAGWLRVYATFWDCVYYKMYYCRLRSRLGAAHAPLHHRWIRTMMFSLWRGS